MNLVGQSSLVFHVEAKEASLGWQPVMRPVSRDNDVHVTTNGYLDFVGLSSHSQGASTGTNTLLPAVLFPVDVDLCSSDPDCSTSFHHDELFEERPWAAQRSRHWSDHDLSIYNSCKVYGRFSVLPCKQPYSHFG